VPDRRIVFSYGMTGGGAPISVSLTTIELSPDSEVTRLVLTEQVAFLNGRDNAADREEGLASMLKIDQLLSSPAMTRGRRRSCRSMRHQQRHAAGRDHLAGGAAQAEEAHDLAAAIGTHDQQVGALAVRVVEQRTAAGAA
jgi:hypothetical protein